MEEHLRRPETTQCEEELSDHEPEQRGDGDDGDADQQRDARPGHEPRQDVASQFVEAEGMGQRRAGQAEREFLRARVRRHDPRAGNGHDDGDGHERESDAQVHS